MFETKGHHRPSQVIIGPGVVNDPGPQCMETSIGLGSQTVMEPGGVSLGAGQEALFPVPPHLYRPARAAHGCQAQQALHRNTVLSPEGPPAGGGNDPDSLYLHAQGLGHLGTVPEGCLGGNKDLQIPLVVEDRQAGLGLQVCMFLRGECKGSLHNCIAFPEGGLHVAREHFTIQEEIPAGIRLVYQGSTLPEGLFRGKDAG